MLKKALESLLQHAQQAIEQRPADAVSTASLGGYTLLDVREDHEYAAGHLPGAISLPRSRLELACPQCEPLVESSKPVLVYCKSGRRSLLAAKTLQQMGINNPISMSGGFDAWQQASKPVENIT